MSETALEGLRVLEFSSERVGAQIGQILADFGAEVILVEPKGGSHLRAEAAWPFWARGKRSIALDLKDPSDVALARKLASRSDVVIDTFRPGVADRLGIGCEALCAENSRLVHASVTAFGRDNPWSDLPGYDAVVNAKLGVNWTLEGMTDRSGPCFCAAAYAPYAATQLALNGILAALYDRETTGLGQRVETSLALALSVYDPLNYYSRVVAERYPGAFEFKPRVLDGIPTGGMSFRLLVALTKDGRWLQFSQTADKLFRAMMHLFELDWMYDDPEWEAIPDLDDAAQRERFWEILLGVVRSKTADEWMEEFERHPDVWGEVFRHGRELLDHPQMIWNDMVVEIDDPERGTVRQPGPLAHMAATPAQPGVAPRLGEHDAAIRQEIDSVAGAATPTAPEKAIDRMPLEGITIVELGTYYAAPFGSTVLAELGARVIKLEEPSGDPLRCMLPFPELAAIKVLQGKESVAVDLRTDEGREIAQRIIAGADIVLQSYRGGIAAKLGLDGATLRARDPDLVYLNAPGYGQSGPFCRRPAYAPTIGAAAGLAWRNAGAAVPEGPDLPPELVRKASLQLGTAVMGVGNADGLSAVTAATAMILGLLARRRGKPAQEMLTSMLSSTAHALSEVMIDYPGQPDTPTAGDDCLGYGALYRLYETAQGWVFLAAFKELDWQRLTATLETGDALTRDERFSDLQARKTHDAALAVALADVFRTKPSQQWESILRANGVACVVAEKGPVERHYMDAGSIGEQLGWIAQCHHPILETAPRLSPLIQFSRSETRMGNAGLVGQQTEEVLREYGYSLAELTALSAKSVILMA